MDRLLGEGGMGVVLAAVNEALRQKVAIKLLRSGALANSKALGRFEREARAAASLRSEHVARVLDVGKLEDGRPFMVMEHLEGCDLGDVIDQGPYLAVGELVDYVLQACEAIAEAHAAGIIHRDLKPRNLFLATTVDGRPLIKVLDFGISKIEDSAEDMSLTRTTEIIGSPSYMSPEQLRASKEVDVRTDIWALGVILYELLTKKVPFQAVTVTDLVAVVLMEPTPDVRLERPDTPDGLVYAINRCLAKRREERFASIAELVGAIAPFGSGRVAGITERVSRVAQGSSRNLPPSDTGSGPYAHLAAGSQTGNSGFGAPPTMPLPMHQQHHSIAPATVPSRGSSPEYARGIGAGYGQIGANGYPAAGPSGMPVAGPNAPPPASSARLAIHGGTSVAWGETQVEQGRPAHPRSRKPLLAFMLGTVVLFCVAGAGAFVYTKRGTPSTTTGTPPADSVAMPYGRKDLPPINPPATAAPTTSVVAAEPEVPSALPSSRVPVNEPKKPVAGGKVAVKAGGQTPSAPPTAPPTPVPSGGVGKPDDLGNIGRR